MRKTKFFTLFITFSLIFTHLYAEDTSALAYSDNEFPQILKDLRRFEIVSLGALPFVSLDVNLGYSTYKYVNSNFNSAYIPNVFANSSYSQDEQVGMLLTSLSICVSIGLTDFIVQTIKRSAANRKIKNSNDSFKVSIKDDPDATKIEINNTKTCQTEENGLNEENVEVIE